MNVYDNILSRSMEELKGETAGDLMTKAISDVGACVEGMQLVEARGLVAVVIIGCILFFYDKSLFKINIRHIWCFAGTGIVGIILFNLCYFTTIAETSLSVAAVLLYTAPIFVMLVNVSRYFQIDLIIILAMFILFINAVQSLPFSRSSSIIKRQILLLSILVVCDYTGWVLDGNPAGYAITLSWTR